MPSAGSPHSRATRARRAPTWRAALTLAALAIACDDEGKARVVEPVYEDPCRFFPDDACSEHGECHPDELNRPMCFCSVGYEGDSCEECEAGFHFDARGLCVTDRGCDGQPSDPCGDEGMCVDEVGVLSCECFESYGGPRCTLCANGYARDNSGRCAPDRRGPVTLDASSGMDAGSGSKPDSSTEPSSRDAGGVADTGPARPNTNCPASSKKRVTVMVKFEGLGGWPSTDNQCDARVELALPELSMKSRVGSTTGYVWACTRTNTYAQGMDTPHVELEAAALQTAQINFPSPAVSLRFDYGAPTNPLSLDVLVDNNTLQTIELPKFGRGTLTLQLATPASTIALRSRSAYRQNIAIDNLEYQADQCP